MSNAPMPRWVTFGTSGLGGILAWVVVHPINTLGVRMNLSGEKSFVGYTRKVFARGELGSLYSGLSAGIARQVVYATSRIGFFDLAKQQLPAGDVTFTSRVGLASGAGALAAVLSCPTEVSLVRLSSDKLLPPEQQRRYAGFADCFARIVREEGPRALWGGVGPFAGRAAVVGATQVGVNDQLKSSIAASGVAPAGSRSNTILAAIGAGIVYSAASQPFETAKNRLAARTPFADGTRPTGMLSSLSGIMRNSGLGAVYAGFSPYFVRCSTHTVVMFLCVEELRRLYPR